MFVAFYFGGGSRPTNETIWDMKTETEGTENVLHEKREKLLERKTNGYKGRNS